MILTKGLGALALGVALTVAANAAPGSASGVGCPATHLTAQEDRDLRLLVSGSAGSLSEAQRGSAREAFKQAKIKCATANRWSARQGQASLFYFVATANRDKAVSELIGGGLSKTIPETAFARLSAEQRLKLSQNNTTPDILAAILKVMVEANLPVVGADEKAARNGELVGGATAGHALVDAANQMFDNPAYKNQMWDELLAKMDF